MQPFFWEFRSLFFNFPLLAAVCSVSAAQTIKISYYLFQRRPFRWGYFVEAGGMPSSHASMVSGLTMAMGWYEGWGSPLFALALIFSGVVMYDSAGVRRAAGRQAVLLNKLCDDVYRDQSHDHYRLTEFVGHSPLEVFAGALIGVVVSTLFYAFIH